MRCANSVSNVLLLHRAGTDGVFFYSHVERSDFSSFGDRYCSDGERKGKKSGEIAIIFFWFERVVTCIVGCRGFVKSKHKINVTLTDYNVKTKLLSCACGT